jgi:hypothetical protein
MNTDEMIEVMQSYARGEQIQIANADKNEWGDIEDPSWNWVMYKYRIKPKKSKFKADEILVRLTHECTPLRRCDIYRIIETTDKITVENRNGIKVQFDYDDLDVDFVKADDVLWYWEFKMSDGWHISQTRMTRAQAQAFVGDNVEIAPLYALGFRIKES